MATARAPIRNVLPSLSCNMLAAGAILPLTCFIPRIDLTSPLALTACWIAESGGTRGTPVIGIGITCVLLSRSGLTWKERVLEFLVIFLSLAALFGGAAYLNEFVVKPRFAVPRPNIVELATLPPDTPVLKMTAKEFYAMPDKAARSEYLKEVLTQTGAPPMHDVIRRHWIKETGYSFPSGHSFSAMLLATTFLALGLTDFSGRRLWVFYSVAVWAVAVCGSRVILRVHSPTDVCVGGFEGIFGGVLCFLLVRRCLEWFSPKCVLSADPGCETST